MTTPAPTVCPAGHPMLVHQIHECDCANGHHDAWHCSGCGKTIYQPDYQPTCAGRPRGPCHPGAGLRGPFDKPLDNDGLPPF